MLRRIIENLIWWAISWQRPAYLVKLCCSLIELVQDSPSCKEILRHHCPHCEYNVQDGRGIKALTLWSLIKQEGGHNA